MSIFIANSFSRFPMKEDKEMENKDDGYTYPVSYIQMDLPQGKLFVIAILCLFQWVFEWDVYILFAMFGNFNAR